MYFDECTLGHEWELAPLRIRLEQITSFCERYDPLPLHLDADYAATTRFGGIISSGVLSFMLMWAEFLRVHDPFGEALIAGMDNHMAWSAPVYPDDELSGTVRIAALTERTHTGIVELTLQAYNQHGTPVMTGGARILLHKKPW